MSSISLKMSGKFSDFSRDTSSNPRKYPLLLDKEYGPSAGDNPSCKINEGEFTTMLSLSVVYNNNEDTTMLSLSVA